MDLPDNETRAHILQVAEKLFASQGYAAVKLRDIADAVGMKHASLYYYMPGGKEQLFIRVFEYSFERHQRGVIQTIKDAGPGIRDQLYAVAYWFLTQPVMSLDRMQQGDRPKISEEEVQRLSLLAYDALRMPIVEALKRAQQTDELDLEDFDLAAMALISLIQSIRSIPGTSKQSRKEIAYQLVDMLLYGWVTR